MPNQNTDISVNKMEYVSDVDINDPIFNTSPKRPSTAMKKGSKSPMIEAHSDNESTQFMAPTADNMRKFELKNQRGLIGSSLVTGAIA